MTGPHKPDDTGVVPGARAALILLLAINLFNYIDRQILAAVVPSIREEFFGAGSEPGAIVGFLLKILQPFLGANPENAMIGLLAMAFMVTYMLAAPIFSWLPLRKWVIISAGVILWSLASGWSGFATTFGALLLTRCLVGIGEAAYGPIAPTMIADYYPEKVRGRILSWFYLAIPVGSALGFVFGGLIAASFLGWRWAFYLVVPPGVLLGLICLLRKDPPVGQADPGADNAEGRNRWKDYLICLKTPSYVLDTLGMAMMTFAIGGMGFWMPSYIHEYRGVADLAQVNMIFGAILVVTGLLATVTGGYLADKLRARFPGSYFLVSGVAMLVAFPFCLASLYLPFEPFPWAWICIFISCFCLFFSTGPTNTILANVTHPALRPAGFALNILIIHALGDVISPLIIGAVSDAAGNNMTAGFLVVSATVLIAGVIWLFGARYLERDTALAKTKLSGGNGAK